MPDSNLHGSLVFASVLAILGCTPLAPATSGDVQSIALPVSSDPQLQRLAWTSVPTLPPRSNALAAILHEEVFLFGGSAWVSGVGAQTYLQTWAWSTSGGLPRLVTDSGPPFESGLGAVLGDRWIVYGPASRRLFAFDRHTWTELFPATLPPVFASATMAALGDALVLYGVVSQGDARQWRYSAGNWEEVHPSRLPPPSGDPRLARVGTHGDRLVLYCGWGPCTWEWDGTTWTERTPTQRPPDRSQHTLVTTGDVALLIGGSAYDNFGHQTTQARDDRWAWDGTDWKWLGSGGAGAPGGAAAAADEDDVWLFGGYASGAYGASRFEATASGWNDHDAKPPARTSASFTSLGSNALWFGGKGLGLSSSEAETWLREGKRWRRVQGTQPSARHEHAVAREGAGAVLFGGSTIDGVRLGDTWTFDGDRWSARTPAISPPARRAHVLARIGADVVLFGGDGEAGLLADTWRWSGGTWQLLAPAHSPPARRFAVLASHGTGAVLFGGEGATGYLADTWQWTGEDWLELHPAHAPSARFRSSITAYEDAVVLHGGSAGSYPLGDTWRFDGTDWVSRGSGISGGSGALVAAVGDGLALYQLWVTVQQYGSVTTAVYQPPGELGSACEGDLACGSGHCASGVCCLTACDGACASCSLPGSIGTCVTLPAATLCRAAIGACDLADYCNGSSPSCPRDARAAAGVECRESRCEAGVITASARCTGSSASCPSEETIACGPFACEGATCLDACGSDADCAPGHWCSSATCVPALERGSACSADTACLSGHCVDGVCCESACDGQCEACDQAGQGGACVAVGGAPRGSRAACGSDGSTCGGVCVASTRNSCTYPVGVACADQACVDGVETSPAACSADGTCPITTRACAPFACAESGTCRSTCELPSHCAAGASCVNATCVVLLGEGQPCDADAACASGSCRQGRCCPVGGCATLSSTDAGSPSTEGDPEEPRRSAGCGCDATRAGALAWLALGLARRRR